MYKDTISKVVRYFRDNEHIEFLYGAMDFIDSNSNYLFKRNYPRRDWRDYAACDYSMIGQPSSFWRSSVFKKIGVFDSTFTMLGDADFYTRVLKSCKYKNSAESFSKFRLVHAWVDFLVILGRFGMVWEPFWDPKGDQSGFKIRSKN